MKKYNRRLLSSNAFQRLIVQGLFFVTFKKLGLGIEKMSYYLICTQRRWGDWLFILAFFFSTVFARSGWLENKCEHEWEKWLFGMNVSFLYWFIRNKDFEWLIKSNSVLSNVSNSSYVTHRQTDRLPFFSWLFVGILFFHGEKKDF